MKKSVKIIMGIVVLLIIARLVLPYFVLKYVNKTLADLDGYTGHVNDVDIALYRGAYQIDSLNIRKVNGKIEEPFISIPKMDLSVEWKSLFKGKLVAEVVCTRPEINFAFSEDENASQTGVETDWTQVIKDLLPININRFTVVDGTINLTNVVSQPSTDLSMHNFDLEIANIRNVVVSDNKFPSPVKASGDLPGYDGTLTFDADMQLLKKMPDFNYNLKLSNLQLVKLNELSKRYGGIDFEKGSLDLVSEMEVVDGKLQGYLKPLTHDMQIFEWNEGDNRTITQFVKELIAEGGNKVLENKVKDQVATRIPLEGTINDVKTGIWPTIIGVLRNGYVSALTDTFDNTLSVKEAWQLYREDRRKQRQERREERKENREEKKAERKK
ncbi:DUF748 domain-containing protein [Persicitalea jodogahamensis]|uniref:DUF748 domain-containing protein n=1 Tax=Persicitalea jodogahamensis TaxID=402147 RepID=A0A8J3D1C2_9BACT|nr:DUF748 domain-containing protein [Persicitalea jodogahamensis]GHB53306.1 hypothetical protein GCM10007390_02570 [Persicitalea jodogahamensis]